MGWVGVRVRPQSCPSGATGNVVFAGRVEDPMKRGDHVLIRRFGYTHHGIYLGDGTVIGYSGEPWRKCDARICHTSIEEFARGGRVQVRHYGARHDAEVTVARAESRIGETDYDLLRNNCEHFACWCVTGQSQSSQVGGALTATGVAGGSGVAAEVGINVVAATGVVAGMSGPGLMSGLATIGSVVGGGAFAGLAVLGVVPALGSVAIMHHALRDSPVYTDEDRLARTAGRCASIAGGGVAALAMLNAVETMGVVGLSGAGISSGLAALGGSMVGGTMLVTALPALSAAVAGYAVYRLVRWWLSDRPNAYRQLRLV